MHLGFFAPFLIFLFKKICFLFPSSSAAGGQGAGSRRGVAPGWGLPRGGTLPEGRGGPAMGAPLGGGFASGVGRGFCLRWLQIGERTPHFGALGGVGGGQRDMPLPGPFPAGGEDSDKL